MSVQQALEARVRANPSAWDAWRVYADWLLEQGDVRGELVHLERRLSTGALSEEERRQAEARVEAIQAEHGPSWLAGFPVQEWALLEWRHGFVIGARLGRWNDQALRLLEALVVHPAACLLSSLELWYNGIGAEGAKALASSAHLRSLTGLRLGYNRIGPEGKAALAASETLRGCRVDA